MVGAENSFPGRTGIEPATLELGNFTAKGGIKTAVRNHTLSRGTVSGPGAAPSNRLNSRETHFLRVVVENLIFLIIFFIFYTNRFTSAVQLPDRFSS